MGLTVFIYLVPNKSLYLRCIICSVVPRLLSLASNKSLGDKPGNEAMYSGCIKVATTPKYKANFTNVTGSNIAVGNQISIL